MTPIVFNGNQTVVVKIGGDEIEEELQTGYDAVPVKKPVSNGAAKMQPVEFDTIAAKLNAGEKFRWPPKTNAVRAKLSDGKKTRVLRGNEDTWRGIGIDEKTVIEFGWVSFDSNRHPQWDRFKVCKSNNQQGGKQ